MGKRGKFGRKPVLQLGSESSKSTSFGFGYKGDVDKPGASTLGGLIGPYGNSDDSHSEDDSAKKDNEGVLKKQAFVRSSEVLQPNPVDAVNAPDQSSTSPKQPSDDDSKLQNFLAEIEALVEPEPTDSVNGDPDIDGQPIADEVEWETDPEAEDTPSEPPPTKPTEPTTDWQHCLDDGTQYYYYWHVTTNQVTWEIPEGYSQYLLLYKEYETRLAKYEKDFKDWEEKQKARPKIKKRRRKVKVTGTNSSLQSENGVRTPAVSGRSESDVDPASAPKPPLIGPLMPDVNGKPASNTTAGSNDVAYKSKAAPVKTTQEARINDEAVATTAEDVALDSSKHDASSLDIDIDTELENALEQTQGGGVKRVLSNESPDLPQMKKQKQSNMHEDSFIDKKCLKDKVATMAEAAELSQLVADKLEFLDVSRSGLSKLQVLLIEMQTRIGDWKCGGLSSDYLVKQLRAADLDLQCYEASAAPPGWQCSWHRNSKRYFYRHVTSGACQWNYPEVDYCTSDQSRGDSRSHSDGNHRNQSHSDNMDQSQRGPMVVSSEKKMADAVSNSKKDIEEMSVDYCHLAGAPPPPPPLSSRVTSSPSAAPTQATSNDVAVAKPTSLVSYSMDATLSDEDNDDVHDAMDAASDVTATAVRLVDDEIEDVAAGRSSPVVAADAVQELDEHADVAVVAVASPTPTKGVTDDGLSSLKNYDQSESSAPSDRESVRSKSERRSKSHDSKRRRHRKHRKDKKKRRRRRRRSSSSSSSSGDRTRRRFRSDSEGDDDRRRSPGPEPEVNVSRESRSVDREEEEEGEIVTPSDDVRDCSRSSATPPPPLPPPLPADGTACEKKADTVLNVIQKPAHFAAAPVLLRSAAEADATEHAQASTTDNGDALESNDTDKQANTARVGGSDDGAGEGGATADGATEAATEETTKHQHKKRKKEKSMSGGGLSMKKKGVKSMVQKWQQVQKEVKKDSKSDKVEQK